MSPAFTDIAIGDPTNYYQLTKEAGGCQAQLSPVANRRKGDMNKIVRFTIAGHAPDTDAPPVEDLLDQMRDFVDVLRGVEEAASGAPGSAIVWRVVEASRNSPVLFGLEAYPKEFATNIDQRVAIILTETAQGFATIKNKAERPRYFTNDVMKKARKIAERVTNGISAATVDFGPGLPEIDLTPSSARAAIRNVDAILARPDKPYQEFGSIEGYLQGVELDGFNRRIAYVRDRVTGESVKCVIPRDALQVARDLSDRQIADVWSRVRVQVSGRLFYKGPGDIDFLKTEEIRFFRSNTELPRIDEIIDEHFTSGLRSEEYLERLRNGTLAV